MKILHLSGICVAILISVFGSVFAGGSARAAVKVQAVDYKQGNATLEGWLAYDDANHDKRPGVVIFPSFFGPGSDEKNAAEKLVKMGYIAFIADVYGKGIRPKTRKDAKAESDKYMKDRRLLTQRAQAAFEQLSKNAMVNPNKLAAMGYCFGAAGALDLARSGAALKAVAALFGTLTSPLPEEDKNIKGRVLALQGADDPIDPRQEDEAFMKEMTDAKVDWQLVLYGGAVHAFAMKTAGNDPSTGAAYNEKAAKRAWQELRQLFKETL